MLAGTLLALVIDDEPQIRRVVGNALTAAPLVVPGGSPDEDGLTVRVLESGTGRAGVDLVAAEAPGLVILDLGLPDMNGIDVCREIRRWSAVPIIVLSARHADTEKAALQVHRDVAERHHRGRLGAVGALLHLTPTEWALLRTLVTHPRQTLTHRQLFHAVWGNTGGDAQQYLRVYVGHLRRKIEGDPVRPRFIQTEPGVGYRFEPDGATPA